jgi:uncharacterized protein (TIGR04255 family)
MRAEMSDPFSEIHYKKHFLKEIIVRVDLASPLPIDTALPKPLFEQIVHTFPMPEPHDAVQREVEFSPGGFASREKHFKEWLFHGKELTKTLTIGPQAVFVQHKAYQTYEVVKAEFIGILNQVAELSQGIQPSRVGLRYVNVIQLDEANPTDWSSYIASQLLALFEFPSEADRATISRVFHNLELMFDDFNLSYRLGMHNPDYPARIRQKVFVLDLDAFTRSVAEFRGIERLLDDFHMAIQRYFEESITENLRRIMNGT